MLAKWQRAQRFVAVYSLNFKHGMDVILFTLWGRILLYGLGASKRLFARKTCSELDSGAAKSAEVFWACKFFFLDSFYLEGAIV